MNIEQENLSRAKDLYLRAESKDDLQIISALVQDAVLKKENIKWIKKRHRFSLLINRFRWELISPELRRVVAPHRVQSILIFDSTTNVWSRGMANALQNEVLSLLQLDLKQQKNCDEIELIFSGKTEIKLRSEFINVLLRDLTVPEVVSLGRVPEHEI